MIPKARPHVCSLLIATVVSLASIACRGRAGEILTLSGSTSLQPLAEKWAEAYESQHPELTIAVQGGGSTAGVHAARVGTAQIGMSSRALTAAETRSVRVIQVARDGIALVVHPANPRGDISLSEARSIYAGHVRTWRVLHGPARAITVITREEGSGTRAAFEGLVMGKQPIASSALVQDSTGAVRQMVSSDPAAIGYISIGLVDRSVKALRLGGVAANETNIDNGTYPLVRPFLFALRDEPQGHVKAFIDWVSGPEGSEVARREGMLPAQRGELDARP
jgi:phosphate transport system substrate-binding protein